MEADVGKITIEVVASSENAQQSIESIVSSLQQLGGVTKTVSSKIKDATAEIVPSSAFSGVDKIAEGVKEAADTTSDYAAQSAAAEGKASSFGSTLSRIGTVAGSVGKSIGSIAKKPLEALLGGFEKIKAKFTNLKKMVTRRVMYRAINAVISMITKGFKEGTDNVYQFSKANDGAFAKSMDTIATSANYIKNSIGAMVTPIINMVAPIFDYLGDRFVDLINSVNQALAQLSGASTWTRAKKYWKEYASAADAAGKKVKATILGIDELNLMQDNSSNGSGDETNYADMFETVELKADATKTTLASVFSGLKEGWDKYGKPVWDSVVRFKDSVSGLVTVISEDLKNAWENGKIADAFESVSGIVTTLTDTTSVFVDKIKNAVEYSGFLGGAWDYITGVLGSFKSIFEGGKTFTKNIDFAALFSEIGKFAKANGNTFKNVGKTIQTVLDALSPLARIIGTIITFMISKGEIFANIISAASSLVNLIVTLTVKLNPMFPLLKIVVNLASTLLELVLGIFTSGLDAVLGGITYALDSLSSALESVYNWFVEVTGIDLDAWADAITLENVANGIKEAFENVGNWFKEKWNAIVSWWEEKTKPIKERFERIGKWWDEHFFSPIRVWINEKIIQPVKDAAESVWKWLDDHIFTPVKDAFTAVGKWFDEKIIQPIKNGLNAVIGWAESVLNFFVRSYNKIAESISKLKIDIPDWLGGGQIGFNMKTIQEVKFGRLADGGMVKQGTAFVAGEAGAEVVANVGSRSGVMNVDQLSAGVSEGVRDANEAQNAILREQNNLLRQLLTQKSNIHATVSVSDIVDGLNRKNRRDGRTVVPVGV